jgi:hypothetical protein
MFQTTRAVVASLLMVGTVTLAQTPEFGAE